MKEETDNVQAKYQSEIPDNPMDLGTWNACWGQCLEYDKTPFVAAFRCLFDVANNDTIRIHVSAYASSAECRK